MISGYVTHPEKIAQIGRIPNMPSLYFFIRHCMNNFRPDKDGKEITTATVSIDEIREHLNSIIKDAKGNIIKIKYPKYSRFKAQVLTVVLDEIKKCYDKGLIDVYFEMSEIRARGKKTGEPVALTFTKKTKEPQVQEISSEPLKKAKKPQAKQTELHFSEEEPQQEVKPSGISWQDAFFEEGNKQWESLVLHYEGRAKELLAKMRFHSKREEGIHGSTLYLACSKETELALRELNLSPEEWKEIHEHIRKHKIIRTMGDIKIIPVITD